MGNLCELTANLEWTMTDHLPLDSWNRHGTPRIYNGGSGRALIFKHLQTSSTLSTFVLLMMLHHDVQRKVQEELDTVVGYTRLPTLEDRATLPYLEAVFTEVYRYTHVASRATYRMLTAFCHHMIRWLTPSPLGKF